MAKQLQLRRGTTVQNDAFIGAIGELTMDTDKKQLRLHDGATLGGIPLMPTMPNYSNGTAWTSAAGNYWTAPSDCVMVILLDQKSNILLKLNDSNGVPLSFLYTPAGCAITQVLPLAKGTVIYTARYSLAETSEIRTYPLGGT